MLHHPHYQHLRKRDHTREPYPSRYVRIAVIDVTVYIVSIASPMFTIPQVYEIFVHQSAAGVSSISWGAYTLFSIPWLTYGIVHRERALIISNSLWLVMNILVFTGSLLY